MEGFILFPRIVLAGVFIFLFIFLYFVLVWYQERAKIYKLPRKEMKLCDIHGAYPAEASIWINALDENRPDLRVEMCPVCYAERIKNSEKLINGR